MTRIEDMVARLGGDEFVVVQTAVPTGSRPRPLPNASCRCSREPVLLPGAGDPRPRVTIGVALAPDDGKTSERLLKSADLALYDGKAGGRNCVRFFTPEMDAALQARLHLEKLIRDAIASDGFVLHYQPVFEMSGEAPGRLRGAGAAAGARRQR